VKNIAFGQPVSAFQIERRKHLARDNRVRDIGRVLGDLLDHTVAEQFAFLVPVSFSQVIGNLMHKAG